MVLCCPDVPDEVKALYTRIKMLNYSAIEAEQVQTQNSEIKNRGVGVKHHGVCEKCSKQTENSTTNPKLGKKIVGWA